MEGVASCRQVRLCGSPLPPCPLCPVQTDSLPTLLVRRKFPFPVSKTQTLDAGSAAGGGDFQFPPLSAPEFLDRSPDLSGLISLSAKWTSKRSSPSGCAELTLFHEKAKSECKPPQQMGTVIASVFKQLMSCRKTEPLRSPSSTSNKSGLIPLPTLGESVTCWRRSAADKRRNEAAQSLVQRWRHRPGGPVRGSRSETTCPKYPLVNPRQKL